MTTTASLTREHLLREVSALLGVGVIDVRRDPELLPVAMPGGRSQHPDDAFGRPRTRGWTLWLAAPLPRAFGRLQPTMHLRSSAVLRSPRSLNVVARDLGRPADAPTLTAADGRRLLSLMHHVHEGDPR